MSTNANLTQRRAAVMKLLEGWTATGVLTPSSLTVRSQVMSEAEVQQRLQDFLDLLNGPDRARVALRAAVAARREGEKAGWQFIADLTSVVTQQFGDTVASKRFGVPMPQVPALPSVETRVIANDHRQKTRKARGIMSQQQREALTGPKERVVIVDAASPAPAEAMPGVVDERG